MRAGGGGGGGGGGGTWRGGEAGQSSFMRIPIHLHPRGDQPDSYLALASKNIGTRQLHDSYWSILTPATSRC